VAALPSDLPELLSALEALPRVALLDGAAVHRGLWPAAQLLAADTFTAGPRPELRFDLLVAPELAQSARADLAAWLGALRDSSRAVLIGVPPARGQELARLLADGSLLARATSAAALGPANDTQAELWLIRGALRWPLIRIDDYPTGVRPIPEDLAPIHRVLTAFEERAVPYCLGIVPGLLTEPMFVFLTTLRYMQPAQHGYDHAYPRMSARLLRHRDPWNERATVGGFNEFRFHRHASIVRKLRAGQELLQARLGKPVTTYIPPCNRCDRSTVRALRALGFTLCLCDLPVPAGPVPVLRSDFYGRSSEARLRPEHEVLCLHTNWEWDLARAGDHAALPTFVDDVRKLSAEKERALLRLASYLNDSAGS
jgi:hypothetical protein